MFCSLKTMPLNQSVGPHCPRSLTTQLRLSIRKCSAGYSPALAPLNPDCQIHKQTAQQRPTVAPFASLRYAFIPLRRKALFSGKETAVGASLSLAQPTTTAEATLPALHPRPKPESLRHSATYLQPATHSCLLSALAPLHSMAFMSRCAPSLLPCIATQCPRTCSLRLINALLFLPGLRLDEPSPNPDRAALQEQSAMALAAWPQQWRKVFNHGDMSLYR